MPPAAPFCARSVSPTTSPGHVGLAVRELGRSIAFYGEAFALTRMDEGSRPPRRTTSVMLRAPLARLGATMTYQGIVLHGDGATSGGLYFTDPDGLRLEIYAASGFAGQAPVGGAPICGFF